MALRIYSTIETDGPYPAVNAADVEMPDGKRLSEVELGGGGGGSCNCPDDLIVDGCTTLLNNPAMEFAYNAPEDGGPAYVALFAVPTGIEAGRTYRVVIDGEESTVTAVELRQELSPEMVMTMVGLGNLALLSPEFEDTGEQFAVQELYLNGEYQSGGMCVPLNGSTAETVTYSVGIYADAVKINEAYLPEAKKATRIDLTNYASNGVIVEHFADGSTFTYTMEFNADGKPVKVTDSGGNVTTLDWGGE